MITIIIRLATLIFRLFDGNGLHNISRPMTGLWTTTIQTVVRRARVFIYLYGIGTTTTTIFHFEKRPAGSVIAIHT